MRYGTAMKRSVAVKVFETLGDPHRFAIVEHLMKSPRSVQELADRLPISRPAVSRHLRLLKASGLVLDEARGAQRIYRLQPDCLEKVRDYFEQLWDEAQRRFVIAAENTRPKRK
jgi:DNA-binding transcriptional ArsR family regulator